MAKLISGRLKNLNIGVSSYTENNNVLVATGNASFTGIVTASSFSGNASLTNLSGTNLNFSGLSTLGRLQISSGIVTATSGIITYYGDGSQLTGISVGSASQWVTNSTGIHTLSSVGIGTTNATSRLTVSGDASFTGIVTASSFSGNASLTNLSGTNLNFTGVGTISTLNATGVSVTAIRSIWNQVGLGLTFTTGIGTNLNVSGVGTIVNLRGTTLNYSGVSTFSSGPVLISNTGTATSTGTAAQPLQVTGGAYVSGSVGFGTTNPREKFDVSGGNISIQGISTSNRFYIQHNTSLNSLDFVFI